MWSYVVTQSAFERNKAQALDNYRRFKATGWPLHLHQAREHLGVALDCRQKLQRMYKEMVG